MPDWRRWRPGSAPGDLTEQEAAGYYVATVLINGGVLPRADLSVCSCPLRPKRPAELIYLVGHYCFVSTTLNGFAIRVPDDRAAN